MKRALCALTNSIVRPTNQVLVVLIILVLLLPLRFGRDKCVGVETHKPKRGEKSSHHGHVRICAFIIRGLGDPQYADVAASLIGAKDHHSNEQNIATAVNPGYFVSSGIERQMWVYHWNASPPRSTGI